MTVADCIITAPRIHTLDQDSPNATAIAVRDGVIVGVGSREELAEHTGPETVVEEFDGTVTPGLNDSHTHVVWGLDLTRGIQLTDLDLWQVRAAVADAARGVQLGNWVHGWGLDPNIFTATGFTGKLFDDVTDGVPLFMRMRDGHSAVINSAAIQAAGLTGREAFADESRIGVDGDGAPNGYVLEVRAMDLVLQAAPPEDTEVLAGRLSEVLRGMATSGIVSTHVMDFHPLTRTLLERLERDGELPVRLRISPIVLPGASAEELDQAVALQGVGGRRWAVEGVKFFMDGTIDNGSAWLNSPDAYGQGTKSIWSDPAAYRTAMRFFADRGIPTATHAIGDRAVGFVLDTIEQLGESARGFHRIEHIETIPDELVPRFAQVGVVASMQPIHGTHHTRGDYTDNWSTRLGVERASHGWRCRDLRDAGATVALGSDWPITPFDPRKMMADTILRRPVDDSEARPIRAEQGLSRLEALEGYTTHAAKAAGQTELAGTIAIGKRADLTVWARDPLTTDAQDLPQIRIIATFLAGKRVDLS